MAYMAKVINGIVVEIQRRTPEYNATQIDKDLFLETSYNIYGGVYYDPATNQPHKDQSLATATAGRKRKNYAGIGYRYDSELDAFIPPTPFPSYKLNETTCLWEAPILIPKDAIINGGKKQYMWNEEQQEWTYTGMYIENGELKQEE